MSNESFAFSSPPPPLFSSPFYAASPQPPLGFIPAPSRSSTSRAPPPPPAPSTSTSTSTPNSSSPPFAYPSAYPSAYSSAYLSYTQQVDTPYTLSDTRSALGISSLSSPPKSPLLFSLPFSLASLVPSRTDTRDTRGVSSPHEHRHIVDQPWSREEDYRTDPTDPTDNTEKTEKTNPTDVHVNAFEDEKGIVSSAGILPRRAPPQGISIASNPVGTEEDVDGAPAGALTFSWNEHVKLHPVGLDRTPPNSILPTSTWSVKSDRTRIPPSLFHEWAATPKHGYLYRKAKRDLGYREVRYEQLEREKEIAARLLTETSASQQREGFLLAASVAADCIDRWSAVVGPGSLDLAYMHLLRAEALLSTKTSSEISNAFSHLEDAHRILEKSPSSDFTNRLLMVYHSNAGYYHRMQGRLLVAKDHFEELVQLVESLDDPSMVSRSQAWNQLGIACSALHMYERSLQAFQKALEYQENAVGSRHLETSHLYNNIGNLFLQQGDFQQALWYYREGAGIILCEAGDSHEDLATCYNNMGIAFRHMRLYNQALEMFNKSLDLRKFLHGDSHTTIAQCLLLIGGVFLSCDDMNTALDCFRDAYNIRISLFHRDHPDMLPVYASLGEVMVKREEYDPAFELLDLALMISTQIFGPNHPDTLQRMLDLADLLLIRGDSNRALKMFLDIARIRVSYFGENHPTVASVYNNIGNALRQQNRYSQALDMYERAKMIFEESHGSCHPSMATVVTNIGHIHLDLGQFEQALRSYLFAKSVRVQVFEHVSVSSHQLVHGASSLSPQFSSTFSPKASHSMISSLSPSTGLRLSSLTETDSVDALTVTSVNLPPTLSFTVSQLGRTSRDPSLRVRDALPAPELAFACKNVAVAYIALGKFAAAAQHLSDFWSVIQGMYPPSHPTYKQSSKEYAQLLRKLRDHGQLVKPKPSLDLSKWLSSTSESPQVMRERGNKSSSLRTPY